MQKFMIAIGIFVLIAGILFLIFGKRLKGMYISLNSFQDKNLVYTFQHTPEIQPVKRIKKEMVTYFILKQEKPCICPNNFPLRDKHIPLSSF